MTENNSDNSLLDDEADSEAVPDLPQAEIDQPETQSVQSTGIDPSMDVASARNDSASLSRLTPGAIVFGALVTVGLTAFVLLARLTVHPFDQIDRKMRVIDVWRRLRNNLPDVAHPTILGIIFDLSIALVIIGSFACIWLALMATDESPKTMNGSERADPVTHVDGPVLETGR